MPTLRSFPSANSLMQSPEPLWILEAFTWWLENLAGGSARSLCFFPLTVSGWGRLVETSNVFGSGAKRAIHLWASHCKNVALLYNDVQGRWSQRGDEFHESIHIGRTKEWALR